MARFCFALLAVLGLSPAATDTNAAGNGRIRAGQSQPPKVRFPAQRKEARSRVLRGGEPRRLSGSPFSVVDVVWSDTDAAPGFIAGIITWSYPAERDQWESLANEGVPKMMVFLANDRDGLGCHGQETEQFLHHADGFCHPNFQVYTPEQFDDKCSAVDTQETDFQIYMPSPLRLTDNESDPCWSFPARYMLVHLTVNGEKVITSKSLSDTAVVGIFDRGTLGLPEQVVEHGGLSFNDTDADDDHVAGLLTWTVDAWTDTTGVKTYGIYLASDALGTNNISLGEVPVGVNEFEIPAGTQRGW